MKRKILYTAMTSLLLGAGSAMAHGPAVTPDLEVWLSGATAQDKGIAALFDNLCVPGTLDNYVDNANPAKLGAAHSALFCTIDNTAGQIPGMTATQPRVLFHKRSAGGSAMGVNPVATATQITHMVINNGNCALNAGSGQYECSISNPGDTIEHLSTFGVSDVEPGMFVDVNVPVTTPPTAPMTPDLLANLEVIPGAALVFNTPVNLALRNALQRAQFATTSVCHPDNANYAANAETQACMPSLSKNQVASLLDGTIKRWSRLYAGATPITATPGVTAPTTDLVHICRRVRGSGTQATTNAKINHVPCTPGAASPVETSNNLQGPIVVLNSGSGDVEVCLDDFNNGTNAGGNNSLLRSAWAIGVQSTEKNTSNAFDYRYIKIGGYAPTIQNAAAGKYEDWVENSFQYRKAGLAGAPTGDALALVQKVASDSGSPAVVRDVLNPGFVYTWGQGGYLALASHGFTPSIPFSINNPITPYSHRVGGSQDSCSVPGIHNNLNSNL